MKTIPLLCNYTDGVMEPAKDARGSDFGYGGQPGGCCGSQLVSSLEIDVRNKGLTIAINDEPTTVVSNDDYTIESVKVGDVYINLKLRQVQ